METGLPAQRAMYPRRLEVQPDLTRDAMLAGQKWGMRLGAEIGQEPAAEGYPDSAVIRGHPIITNMRPVVAGPWPACSSGAAGIPSLVATSAAAQTVTCVPVAQCAGQEFGCFITAREELGRVAQGFSSLLAHRRLHHSGSRPREPRLRAAPWCCPWAGSGSSPSRNAGGGLRAANGSPRWAPCPWSTPTPSRPCTWRRVQAGNALRGPPASGGRGLVHRRGRTMPGNSGREARAAGRGPGVMVRGGLPMILTGTGTSVRRSLVLILQDAAKPRSMLATDWTPAGLCRS